MEENGALPEHLNYSAERKKQVLGSFGWLVGLGFLSIRVLEDKKKIQNSILYFTFLLASCWQALHLGIILHQALKI